MSIRTWGRLGAASGAAFVVLSLVGSGGGGQGPANNASREEIGRYFTTAPTSGGFTAAGPLLEILATLSLLIFWAHISTLLQRAEGDDGLLSRVAFGAGVGWVALKLGSFPAAYALRTRAGKGLDPALATALFDMNNAAFVLGWAAGALALGAVAAASVRYNALPRWVGYSAAVICAGLLIAIPFSSGAGMIAFLALLLWLLSTSIALVVHPESASTVRADHPMSVGGPALS
jgi:hypothetical protein